jgi:hypothetical protein
MMSPISLQSKRIATTALAPRARASRHMRSRAWLRLSVSSLVYPATSPPGATTTAERIRHAATVAVPDATWSPAFTADSLRYAAACSTVISHNCEILLRTLAARAEQLGSDGVAHRLVSCADAAGQARASWLHTARAWYRITTDTRGTMSPAAAETGDLALWTGRLAYADPSWTPALGPSHEIRTPQALAPELGDLPIFVAAVHQGSETLTRIAAADNSQISAAAEAGRLLVPTRSLPDRFDIPHSFATAPRDRVRALLDAYQDAGTASDQATGAVATVATPAIMGGRTMQRWLRVRSEDLEADEELTGRVSRAVGYARSLPPKR